MMRIGVRPVGGTFAAVAVAIAARPHLHSGSECEAGESRHDKKKRPLLAPVLRDSFAPPAGGVGSFVVGALKVEHHLPPLNWIQQHILGMIPPPGDAVPTVVRALRERDGRITWLRAFDGGRVFVGSRWDADMIADGRPASEAFGPVHFVQQLEIADAPLPSGASGSVATALAQRATLRHTGTNLLGAIPLPVWLLNVHCQMDVHPDGDGYDLQVHVRLLGAPMVSYSGSLRALPPSTLPLRVPDFHHVVLFDGNCRLCNASVDFVIRNDAAKRFVFAPQSSDAAKRLLSAVEAAGRPEPEGGGASAAVKSGTGRTGAEDSVIVITPDGTVHEQSDAALAVGRALTPPWWPPLAALGTALLPRAARDAAYAYVGRHRYAWFGKREGGRREWDPEEEDHRFLDRNERQRRGAALAGGGVAETASSRPSETPPSR